MSARISHTVTSGTFSLDGDTVHVDNNAWVIGDDTECVVIDVPHDIQPILDLIDTRGVTAILATHAHDDHIRAAPELAHATDAPILLHPDDLAVWQQTHPRHQPDRHLQHNQLITVAGTEIRVLHTPGHTPGSCCFYAPQLSTVFTGDTLFDGGPGATGRRFSDPDTIIASIHNVLFALPPRTVVRTGHGPNTTIVKAQANLC